MSKFWLAVKDWLEATSYFCVVLGIGFAVVQYLTSIETHKQQTAVSYIHEFQSERLVQSRLNLHRPWLDFPINQISGKSGSTEVIDDLALSFTFPNGKPTKTDDLVRVVDFLDLIGTCVEANICDDRIMKEHFGRYIQNLSCLYQAPLERLRTQHGLTYIGTSMNKVVGKSLNCS